MKQVTTMLIVALAINTMPRATAATLKEVDLASDTAWTLAIDGPEKRAIKVPGNGWNSDRQTPRINQLSGVRDFVVYQREIRIPEDAAGQAVLLQCGAINFGAEIYLDGKKAGEHHGPMMPFEVDLTPLVRPGKTHTLRIKAFHKRHYIVKGDRLGLLIPSAFDYGNPNYSKFAYGISRYIRLAIVPAVRLADVFVKTSVPESSLTAELTLENRTEQERTVKLSGSFRPWNQGASWDYPAVPETTVTLPPNSRKTFHLGPIPWLLGPESYWWPNIPFREEYQAQLHFLDVTITEADKTWQTKSSRFGFCTHAEGPYYYTVNGVRVTGFSDATTESQMGFDAYMGPAFAPPTKPGTGCPETWRRYLRIGINTNRICQSTPTEYMMAAADEVGFMLIPETAIRGASGLDGAKEGWHDIYTPQAVQELVGTCRNHPSTIRYSLLNEIQWHNAGFTDEWRSLIDAALEVDDTRPLVYEVWDKKIGINSIGKGFSEPPVRTEALNLGEKSSYQRINGIKRGHAYLTHHYPKAIPRPCDTIFPIGEVAWGGPGGGLSAFAGCAVDMRINDICYFSGWSWMNYWPNFLEGLSYKSHAWKSSTSNKDRRDGIDGWGSPVINFTQKRLHPYLVADLQLETLNPKYSARWPEKTDRYDTGEIITREIEVFNGGLFGDRMSLRWSARWDSPDGPVAARGDTIGPFAVKPGFHTTQTISFPAPAPGKSQRRLYLVLQSIKDDQVVFVENAIYFTIGNLQWTKVDDGNKAVAYSAGWKTYKDDPSYRNTVHYSSQTGATATFTFTGTKARFYGCRRNDLGIAEIAVDGQVKATLDLYQPSREYVKLYDTDELPPGNHTLEVKVTGKKHRDSVNHYVIVDAFGFARTEAQGEDKN